MAAFDQAWYFTLTQEIGPEWTTPAGAVPTDADIVAGRIDSAAQRKKVGYLAGPPTVERKFGILQGINPIIDVTTLTYEQATETAREEYWQKSQNEQRSPESIVGTGPTAKPRTAIMLFDSRFLLGAGGAKFVLSGINLASLSDSAACIAFQEAHESFIRVLVSENQAKRRFSDKWIARSRALLQFAQSTTL